MSSIKTILPTVNEESSCMKSVFSIIWKVIAVAMICVGVYLLVQVMGEAESVIESYEQLTGNSIGATNSIKIVFLRDYIRHTGNTDILITLGVTAAEKELIVNDNIDLEGVTPDDETQVPGEEDNSNNGGGGSGGGGSGGNGGGSGGGGSGGTGEDDEDGTSPAPGENNSINYVSPYDTAGHIKQSDPAWAKLTGSGGSTLKSAGCGIFAIYNAYVSNCGGNPKRLEDIILEFAASDSSVNVTVNSSGYLQGNLNAVAEGSGLWNYIARNYYNPGSVVQASGTVNSALPSDGKYIVYYNHAGSGQHWVYAVKSGSTYKVYNQGKEGANIGGCSIRKYYKLS